MAQENYSPAPQKKRNPLLMVLAGIGGVVVLCCVGVLGLAVLNGGKGATTTNGAGSSTSTSHAPAKVGSTITVDDVSCTLVSVKPIAGDEFIKPKPGNEFIVVQVKIINKSSSEADYNPFDFHVKSGAGNITDEEIPPSTYTANNDLQSGTLAPNGSVTGDIIFQAPKGDHKAELTWQPSFFGDKSDNAWLLGL